MLCTRQIVQKTKKTFILSDSEDDTKIAEKDKQRSVQSKPSRESGNGKERQEISSDNIFGKKPITRIEEAKANRKLQKLVNIIKML